MLRNIKSTFVFTVLQVKIYLRIKEALIFGILMPIIIFILFGMLWGKNISYFPFLLSGVIGMTVTSDSLFSIGPIIKAYRDQNILKFLQNLPTHILTNILGIILSRIIILFVTSLILIISCRIFFEYVLPFDDFIMYMSGLFLGIVMFSFLGLSVSFYSEAESGKGVLNVIYYLMLFMSGVFYPVENLNENIYKISQTLPLTHLLNFMRGDKSYLPIILGWILLFATSFVLIYRKSSVSR